MTRRIHLNKKMDSSQFPSEEDMPEKETVLKKEAKKDDKKPEEVKDTSQETDESQAQIDELTQQRDDFEDKYLRSQAEIQNMRQRYEKQEQQLLKYDGQKLAKEILPAIDNIERALAVEVDDEKGQQLKKGIEITLGSLQEALKDNNVTEIEALGQTFDPNIHQAIQTVPADDDHPVDTVTAVLQKGYMLKDRVLRPSMVVVAN